MTVSVLEAAALDRLLRAHVGDIAEPFRKTVAAIVDTPWRLTTGEDFGHPEAAGDRPAGITLLHWYMERLHVHAARGRALTLAFYRVMHMLDAPSALFRPGIVWRVLRRPVTRSAAVVR